MLNIGIFRIQKKNMPKVATYTKMGRNIIVMPIPF